MEALAAAFVAGVGSAASPCLLPLYPSFLAYLSANAEHLHGRRGTALLGALVLGGVLSAMLVIAGVMLAVAAPLGTLLVYVVPLVDAILILLGVLLIAGRNPFLRLPAARVPLAGGPYVNAYLYGAMLGPIALPCAGPFLVAVLAISVGVAEAATRVGTFVVYGLGFGLPLLLLSVATATRQRQLTRWLADRHRLVEVLAGTVLVVAGAYDLVLNWESIRFGLGV